MALVLVPELPADEKGHLLLWYAADSENSQTPNRIGLAEGSWASP